MKNYGNYNFIRYDSALTHASVNFAVSHVAGMC